MSPSARSATGRISVRSSPRRLARRPAAAAAVFEHRHERGSVLIHGMQSGANSTRPTGETALGHRIRARSARQALMRQSPEANAVRPINPRLLGRASAPQSRPMKQHESIPRAHGAEQSRTTTEFNRPSRPEVRDQTASRAGRTRRRCPTRRAGSRGVSKPAARTAQPPVRDLHKAAEAQAHTSRFGLAVGALLA